MLARLGGLVKLVKPEFGAAPLGNGAVAGGSVATTANNFEVKKSKIEKKG